MRTEKNKKSKLMPELLIPDFHNFLKVTLYAYMAFNFLSTLSFFIPP